MSFFAFDESDDLGSFLRQELKFFAFIAFIIFAFSFIFSWNMGLGFFLLILGLPVMTLVLLVGTLIWFIKGLRFTRELAGAHDKAIVSIAAPILCVGTVIVAWGLFPVGIYLGTMSRLLVNHGRYEAIIANVQANPKPAWYKEEGGVTYSVDLGPPVRLAFNPEGFLDNWSGIIYDPTGDVMLARGFDPVTGKFFAPDRVTKLFEGDLVGCRHLWGSYYDCSFT